MKIAFLSTITGYPWGGADFMWTRTAEAAAERGDRLLLVLGPATAEHPRIGALIQQGAMLCLQPKASPPPSLARRILHRLWRPAPPPDLVVKALAQFRPDLVIVSCGATYDLAYFPAWTAWLQATRTPFSLIANWQAEHPALPPAETGRIKDVFPAARLLAFVSTRNLENTRRHLLLPLPNAHVLHNPLRWQPADATPWPDNVSPARLATVSRLEEGKGIHLLLHALAAVPARDWHLDIFGRGPQETALRALVAHLALDDRVTLRGHVGELRQVWADNHLLCSPALEEGVPMTIPEAMLCGRPVLATCVGGAEDWLRDGETGFLCSAPTVPLLTATLAAALGRRGEWARLGKNAAAQAQRYYRPGDFQALLASSGHE